jgi:hypothetical protein
MSARLLAATLLLCACSGTDDDDVGDTSSSSGPMETSTEESSSSTGVPEIDYATMVQPIWNTACTCHLQGPSGTMTATVLTLNEEVSYANLVGAASEEAMGVVRIAPGDPQGSYLWHKLSGTQMSVGGSGTPMPQIGMLTEEQMSAIEDWILGGALP